MHPDYIFVGEISSKKTISADALVSRLVKFIEIVNGLEMSERRNWRKISILE